MTHMFRCAITQNWKTSLVQDSLLLQQKILWVGYTIVDTFSINTLIVQYETLGNSTVQSENVFEKQIIRFLTFHLQLFHQVVGYWPEWRHTLLHLCVGYDEVLLPGYTHQYFLAQNWDEGVLQKKSGSHHCVVTMPWYESCSKFSVSRTATISWNLQPRHILSSPACT